MVVAASYPKDVADHFVEFLSLAGIDVATMSSHDIFTAGEVGRLSKNDVLAMAADFDTSKAEALLIPDTAMHSLDWLDELEAAANRPVVTANQVTVWEGLNLLGRVPRLEGMGSLFAC